MTCLTDLEIGSSIANLLPVVDRGLPDPVAWTYLPYSKVEVLGNGHTKGFGFPSATWQWSELGQQQLHVLLDMFESEDDASVECAIRTYKDTGIKRNPASFTAIMHRPIDGSGKTIVPKSSHPTYRNVTVRFTRLVEETGYI